MLPRRDDPSRALQEALRARYTLYGELGRGGMGIVYLAHDAILGRPVALKVLPPAAVGTAWRDRFFREARIAAQLSHPNIVPIHAVEQAGDFVYFTMPYIEGESLGARVRRAGRLPAGEVVNIMYDVALAMDYAHGRGVIHRDIKPDNILLEAESGRPMLLDFGIAQRGEDPDVGSGYVQGTLAFLSPERALGQPSGPQSDIYALGVTAYYAATGQVPFRPTDPDDIVATHARRAVPTLQVRGQDGDDTLAKVIEKCLAGDPRERFQTGGELADALAGAPELRGETPVPLRAFVARSHGFARSMGGLSVMTGLAALGVAEGVMAGNAIFAAWAGAILAALLVTPALGILGAIRRALRAGYGLDDMLHALEEDLAGRRAEVAYELGGEPERRGRLARRIAYGALAVSGGAAGWLVLGLPGSVAALTAFLVGIPITLVAGAVGNMRSRVPRHALAARPWLRLWRGALGRWAVRIAGLALPGAGASTEADLPDVVELLDSQIARIRAWLAAPDTMDAAVPDISEWATGQLPALDSLRARLASMQQDGSIPQSLTGDLAAARRVCEMVELALGAKLAGEDMGRR